MSDTGAIKLARVTGGWRAVYPGLPDMMAATKAHARSKNISLRDMIVCSEVDAQ